MRVDDRPLVASHAGGAHRVVQGLHATPRMLNEVVIGAQLASRLHRLGEVARQRSATDEIKGEPKSFDHRVEILRRPEVVGIDERRVLRIAVAKSNLTAGIHRHEGGRHREAGPTGIAQALLVELSGSGVPLDVGRRQLGPRAQESARLGNVAGHRSATGGLPLHEPQRVLTVVERPGVAGSPDERNHWVIAEILTHAR